MHFAPPMREAEHLNDLTPAQGDIMARAPKNKPAPAPEPEEEEGGTTRGPGEMHELFSEFLKEETGVDVSPEAIFLVTSKRTAFRKSEEYLAYAEAQEKLREEKLAQKEERAKARVAKPADEEEAEEKPARRRGKSKAAPEEAEAEKVTPIRGRRRGKAGTGQQDAEADEAQATPTKPAPPRRRRSNAPANF